MKLEEEEAAAAAMLNPDKAPEVKIYAKGICCFVFLQQVKIFVKNLHKVKVCSQTPVLIVSLSARICN